MTTFIIIALLFAILWSISGEKAKDLIAMVVFVILVTGAVIFVSALHG
jgi:uncharacterized membrane protein